MLRRKGYRFRLKPTAEQAVAFSRFAGSCRLVWNKILELQKRHVDKKEVVLSYAESCRRLIGLKGEHAFLREIHSQPLQQSLKDLSRALKESLGGGKGFPKFKKRGRGDSFRYPQGTKLDGNRVYLPKIGWVKFWKSQDVEGTTKNTTVSRVHGKWYVSIQVEREVDEPTHPSDSAVGIDVGVVRFATLSDGTVIEPINSFRKLKYKLAKEQRRLSRKQKLSNNWLKQKLKVQRVYSKVADVRRDFLHKLTSAICNNHAIVVLEDLRVKNMSASAKGTVADPGKNVKAKAGLNLSILDQGWYEFRRQLEYKQEWRGGKVIVVNAVNTSLKCSNCHHVAKDNRLNQAEFKCVQCQYEEHADLNAAKNILAAGRAVIACGDIRPTAA